jgi:hypothetical protein
VGFHLVESARQGVTSGLGRAAERDVPRALRRRHESPVRPPLSRTLGDIDQRLGGGIWLF